MKKIVLLVCAVAAMNSLVFAGGDIKEVTSTEEPVVVPMVEELSGFYAGLGIAAVAIYDAGVSIEWSGNTQYQDRLGSISFIAGYDFNEYIALEGRYTTSVMHDSWTEVSGWSLFVKPQYPVNEDFFVYALIGFGGVTADGVDVNHHTNVDDTGFQWGLGASYMVAENISFFADYTWLADEMDGIFHNGALSIDTDVFTVGINYYF